MATDTLPQEILKRLRNDYKKYKTVSLSECEVRDGLVLVNRLVYISEKPDLSL